MRADEMTAGVQKEEEGESADNREKESTIVCGASSYEEKYYLNPLFARMQIICVMFTQDVGGVFTLEIDRNGELQMRTESRSDDFSFDEIGSELKIRELQRAKEELFRSLELYYSLVVKSGGK